MFMDMRKLLLSTAIVIALAGVYLVNCRPTQQDKLADVKRVVSADMKSFQQFLQDTLLNKVTQREGRSQLQASFLKARAFYKQVEWATEYFMPTTTRFVNGPPLPEIENEENKIFEPEGLQVVEELLYAGDTLAYSNLERQVRLLVAHASTYLKYWEVLEITETQVLDALKLQVFRIATLGITGFDAPLAKSGITEAAHSLNGLQKNLAGFADAPGKEVKQAATYAMNNREFDNFDRALFIKKYLDPITIRITINQTQSTGFVKDKRLLKPSAATLFSKGAFDVNAFTPDSSYYYSVEKKELGKKLFHDPILSEKGTRSCASCHQPQKAFTDGVRTSPSLGRGSLKRNTPTLLNAALQPWQFYDMRTTNLENQSKDVISNKEEMHGDITMAVSKMQTDETYQVLYRRAFPKEKTFSEKHLQNALASYVRSLSQLNSRFDRYMQGDNRSVTIQEIKGFNLFTGKARCGTCHFLPLFNGAVPPGFTKMDSEVIGVPSSEKSLLLDSDPGRFATFQLAPYLNAFKTTTVRNVEHTAPYMHNGAFNTLDEVVHFYNEGGGEGLGIKLMNQTLPAEKLNLTKAEKEALKLFMKALTDEYRSLE